MNPPDQSALWAAYGAALGVVGHLELEVRVANIEARIRRIRARHPPPSDVGERLVQRCADNAAKGTLGIAVDAFRSFYGSVLDPEASQAFDNAVEYRNYLAHHFFAPNFHLLFSPDGLSNLVEQCEAGQRLFMLCRAVIAEHNLSDMDRFHRHALRVTERE